MKTTKTSATKKAAAATKKAAPKPATKKAAANPASKSAQANVQAIPADMVKVFDGTQEIAERAYRWLHNGQIPAKVVNTASGSMILVTKPYEKNAVKSLGLFAAKELKKVAEPEVVLDSATNLPKWLTPPEIVVLEKGVHLIFANNSASGTVYHGAIVEKAEKDRIHVYLYNKASVPKFRTAIVRDRKMIMDSTEYVVRLANSKETATIELYKATAEKEFPVQKPIEGVAQGSVLSVTYKATKGMWPGTFQGEVTSVHDKGYKLEVRLIFDDASEAPITVELQDSRWIDLTNSVQVTVVAATEKEAAQFAEYKSKFEAKNTPKPTKPAKKSSSPSSKMKEAAPEGILEGRAKRASSDGPVRQIKKGGKAVAK